MIKTAKKIVPFVHDWQIISVKKNSSSDAIVKNLECSVCGKSKSVEKKSFSEEL